MSTAAAAVANASSNQFAVFVAVTGIIACAAGWGAYTMLIRKRVLQDTPTALIRSAPQGYVELQGYAEMMDGEPIHAPLSRRSCIWYEYEIEEKKRDFTSKNNRYEWRTIEKGISDNLFYLVDSSGRCAVDPDGAAVTASSHDVWYGKDRYPGRMAAESGWVRFSGISQIGRNFRFTEKRIETGDPLYALGDFITHGGAGAHFDRNAEVRELLREWKQNSDAMLQRFDTNNDGEIDMSEWNDARVAAEKEVDAKKHEHAVAPPVDVLGNTRGSRNPFIIAAKTEAEMLSHFHWSAVGLFILAIASGAALLWLISVR